jgi:putative SOS response-associated peptidase YedK
LFFYQTVCIIDKFFKRILINHRFSKTHKQDEPFAFAGLYNDWLNPATGDIRRTYTIVTTEANELMAVIHNNKKRMPVSLTPEREELWLNGVETEEFKNDSIDLLATPV